MQYTVGSLTDFTDDDPVFEAMQSAAEHAIELSEGDTCFAFGIWNVETGDCLAIAYGGELFARLVGQE